MIKHAKTAVIFGGTGFIGRQVVRDLARRGVLIKVASRIPERAYFLKPDGDVGQIVPVACNYTSDSIRSVIKGCDFVVNCIGILAEKRRSKFRRMHVDVPKLIAGACKAENVESFVHISALACERGQSKYAKSKVAGEEAVLKSFPQATILRPSVVFGEDDSFFNMFAEMARFLPCLPLIGGGKTKFQPVYVGDVALAACKALTTPAAKGKIYELGGPKTVSFKEIYKIIAHYTGRERTLIYIPMFVAKIQGRFMQLLPKPPLTPDQVTSLKTDNVMNEQALGLSDLGISPTAMEMILPEYLERFRAGGVFASQKVA